MPKKRPSKPVWWKNTFFLFAAMLLVVAGAGIVGGDALIRDPGQVNERMPLFLIYLGGAVVLLVNGLLSHRQAVQSFEEAEDDL